MWQCPGKPIKQLYQCQLPHRIRLRLRRHCSYAFSVTKLWQQIAEYAPREIVLPRTVALLWNACRYGFATPTTTEH